MAISWINYKGKKILFIDLKDTDAKEMLDIVEEQKKIIDKSLEPVLLLNDFRDSFATKEYMEKAKQYGKEQKDKIHKTALIGIEGIKKILVKAYIKFSGNDTTKFFNNLEEAKEYLVE